MTTIPSEEDLVALAIECFRVAFDGFEDPIDLSADSFLAQFAKALVTSTYSQLVAVAGAERDAIPGRVQQAIERAAKLLEPKVQTVSLERSTLRSEQEVDAWLGRQKSRLLEGLKQGPVLVN